MRPEPIIDPEGDRIAAQDRWDRICEKAGVIDPRPIDPCPTCGLRAKEFIKGHWICACDLGVVGR